MKLKGIDVSHWNGKIDFEKVKKSGIDFVIIKAGGSDKGFYKDVKFDEYYSGATGAGLLIGSYYFVGKNCTSYDDGVADAERFYNIIKGKIFDYPVYIDLESTAPQNKKGATDACIGFCRTMEKHGYYSGIYASDVSGFNERLELSRLTDFDKWVARYGTSPKIVKDYGVWQYSSEGKIDGIRGFVDLDISNKSYPTIMKRAYLNGY